MTPVTIVSVVPKKSGLYVVTDSLGHMHATKDLWLASLADHYWKAGERVYIGSGSGWFYRNLWVITPAPVVVFETPA